MKWEMEIEEIEAVLEKLCDLHDKLSDAIHSISRAHFLNSVKAPKKVDQKNVISDEKSGGYVFYKDFSVEQDVDSAIQEAKSLNVIRTAIENLEDQLEFFHTVQVQQRAERDAAIARIEQSRIILAMRLAEHHGKKYKVIEEAQAFVGDVRNTSCFISSENIFGPPFGPSCESVETSQGKWSHILRNAICSSVNFAKRSLQLDHVGGIVGNAAVIALSIIALLQFQQISYNDDPKKHVDGVQINRKAKRKTTWLEESPSDPHLSNLDVMLARG